MTLVFDLMTQVIDNIMKMAINTTAADGTTTVIMVMNLSPARPKIQKQGLKREGDGDFNTYLHCHQVELPEVLKMT